MNHELQSRPSGASPAVEPEFALLLLIELAGGWYALPGERVRESVCSPRVTRMPGLPEWAHGVFRMGGRIAPLIDLGQFLGVSRAPASPHSPVVHAIDEDGGVVAGFALEQVHGLLTESGPLMPRPASEGRASSVALGSFESEGKEVVLLDLDRLLTEAEMS